VQTAGYFPKSQTDIGKELDLSSQMETGYLQYEDQTQSFLPALTGWNPFKITLYTLCPHSSKKKKKPHHRKTITILEGM